MGTMSFCTFDTAIGLCGLAWGADGIASVALLEGDAEETAAHLRRRAPGAVRAEPDSEVTQAIGSIRALLSTGRGDLRGVRLDLAGIEPFARTVYAVARELAPGTTTTYGAIAERLGDPLLARVVGQALGANPLPIIVPCHRVVAAGGRLGGFSARGGTRTKQLLLAIERAKATS
jgi:methylated-DNA-[protein]-cysteine S-methyltransferase